MDSHFIYIDVIVYRNYLLNLTIKNTHFKCRLFYEQYQIDIQALKKHFAPLKYLSARQFIVYIILLNSICCKSKSCCICYIKI